MGVKSGIKSFIGGLVLTLILVVIVPVVVNKYISGYIVDIVGDTTFLTLSSDVIVNILIWLVMIGFMVLLGAGGILRKFGVIGILGLIVAYWLLGDVRDAIIPLVTLAIVLVLTKTYRMKKDKKKKQECSE